MPWCNTTALLTQQPRTEHSNTAHDASSILHHGGEQQRPLPYEFEYHIVSSPSMRALPLGGCRNKRCRTTQKAASRACLVYKYILTPTMISTESNRLLDLELPSVTMIAGQSASSLGKPCRPAATQTQRMAAQRQLSAPPYAFRVLRLSYSCDSIDKILSFSLECSSTRTYAIICSVHRCGALSIELLQCRIALVFHHPSLLEVCDLYRHQHCSPRNSTAILLRTQCTHPTTRACALEFSELRCAHLSCLLVFSYTVDDVVLLQAPEEAVATFPAYCTSAAIGCYETAILRGCGRRRCRLRGRAAEPAHCGLCDVVYD